MLPHTKLHEEGFLDNNKITLEVYIDVVEVIHEGKPTANEMVTMHGFQVLNSQVSQGASETFSFFFGSHKCKPA